VTEAWQGGGGRGRVRFDVKAIVRKGSCFCGGPTERNPDILCGKGGKKKGEGTQDSKLARRKKKKRLWKEASRRIDAATEWKKERGRGKRVIEQRHAHATVRGLEKELKSLVFSKRGQGKTGGWGRDYFLLHGQNSFSFRGPTRC